MSEHAISADEQLTLRYDPRLWRLDGPDGQPVLEVRAQTLFYHPLFGQWRDLPPGDRISADGIESVQVRWDGGWAVGVTLAPGGLWRRLVRWADTRDIRQADDAARALSALVGVPLRAEGGEQPAVLRVGYARSEPAPDQLPEAPFPAGLRDPALLAQEPAPAAPFSPSPAPARTAGESASMRSPVYTIDTEPEVRLPLRLGNGAVLARDGENRLRLTTPVSKRSASVAVILLGLLVVLLLVGVLWAVIEAAFPVEPVLGVALGGGLLVLVGLVGVILLARLERRTQDQVTFDRAARKITIRSGAEAGKPLEMSFAAVHGVRILGASTARRRHLAYRRSVALIADSGDIPVFEEVRETTLPPDPAVVPSLVALRHQADELAGPSLARAGARVIAWFLAVPLADE
ncbi:MAG: hypothetical protein JXN59_15270 [Anaerolineae bacterium]|nr:hypothetical protein [Anaerolineae bacterium]